MKFTLEIELHGDQIIDPNLPVEIIREKLVRYIENVLNNDAGNSMAEFSEIWIDVTDDGDGKCNVYSIRSIK